MVRRIGQPRQIGGYNFRPQFETDRDALMTAAYAEAAGEFRNNPAMRQQAVEAVMHNIQNRALGGFKMNNKTSDEYWRGHDLNSIRDQVLAPKQYSSFNPNSPKVNIAGRNAIEALKDPKVREEFGAYADNVMGRMTPDPTHGASNYRNSAHSSKASNAWFNQLQDKVDIGHHTFGRAPGFKVPEDNPTPQLGDQQMLAGMRGAPTTASQDLMASLQRASSQPIQNASAAATQQRLPDLDVGGGRNIAAQSAPVSAASSPHSFSPPPPGSVLNRINPADPSGPLRSEVMNAQPATTVGATDFGRGIPTSSMLAPGMNPQLVTAHAQSDRPQVGANDFGRGVGASNMPTPPFNPTLDQAPSNGPYGGPTELAQQLNRQWAERPPYVPATPTEHPYGGPTALAQQLNDQWASRPPFGDPNTRRPDVGLNDFGKGIGPSSMQTPAMNPQLGEIMAARVAPAATPTSQPMASPLVGDRGFSGGISLGDRPTFGGEPYSTARVTHSPMPENIQLSEPMGRTGGGVEGMAGNAGPLLQPEFMSQMPMGSSGQDGFNSGLSDLFSNAFMPATPDGMGGGFGGMGEMGGGFDIGGFDLGGLFG
jgi:hypothetical protein